MISFDSTCQSALSAFWQVPGTGFFPIGLLPINCFFPAVFPLLWAQFCSYPFAFLGITRPNTYLKNALFRFPAICFLDTGIDTSNHSISLFLGFFPLFWAQFWAKPFAFLDINYPNIYLKDGLFSFTGYGSLPIEITIWNTPISLFWLVFPWLWAHFLPGPFAFLHINYPSIYLKDSLFSFPVLCFLPSEITIWNTPISSF